MQSKEKNQQESKVVDKALSLDARDVAQNSNDEVLPKTEAATDIKDRLEINIVNATDQFQEVEIIYGDKKKRKKITHFLPKNFANFIYAITGQPSPSAKLGVTNLANLSKKTSDNNLFLPEKFLRILTKINQVSELKTPQKIWDSEERINTSEKAILVAVINRSKPENEHLDRLTVSMRSYEIPDQKSFVKFISEVLDLTKNPEKLAKVLFGNLSEKLSDDKKSNLTNCLDNIINESDDQRRGHQIKFLQKIVSEVGNARENAH